MRPGMRGWNAWSKRGSGHGLCSAQNVWDNRNLHVKVLLSAQCPQHVRNLRSLHEMYLMMVIILCPLLIPHNLNYPTSTGSNKILYKTQSLVVFLFPVTLPFVCIRLIFLYCWNSWEEFAKWNGFCTCTWVPLFRLLFCFALFFLERPTLLHFHNKTLCSWHHCLRNKRETTRVTFEVLTPWTCSPVSAIGRSHPTGQHSQVLKGNLI